MNRNLLRIVAAFLVPCLLADPITGMASTRHGGLPLQFLFVSRALVQKTFTGDPAIVHEVVAALRSIPDAIKYGGNNGIGELASGPPFSRRGFWVALAAAAGWVGLSTLPIRAEPLSLQDQAQDSAVSQAIYKELSAYRADLPAQEKNLPPRIFAMVRRALNEYLQILPEDKSARDVINRSMNRLQDDVFEQDYLFDWRIDTPALFFEDPTIRSTFYELKPGDREIVELHVKGRIVRVAVYPKSVASGENPYFWMGKAFPKRNLVLVDENNVHSERMRLLPGLSFETDFGVDEAIGREAIGGLCCPPPVVSRDELESIVRQDNVAHEVLHVYFELLYPAGDNMSKSETYEYYGRNELASYVGELALAKYPYLNLLYRLRDLKAASGPALFGGPTVSGHPGESAEEVFRGLARELGGRFKKRKDRRLARKIARGSGPVSVKQAASLFEALLRDRQTISEGDIRTAARKIYEARIGSFVDDFKPVAHLFPGGLEILLAGSAAGPPDSNRATSNPGSTESADAPVEQPGAPVPPGPPPGINSELRSAAAAAMEQVRDIYEFAFNRFGTQGLEAIQEGVLAIETYSRQLTISSVQNMANDMGNTFHSILLFPESSQITSETILSAVRETHEEIQRAIIGLGQWPANRPLPITVMDNLDWQLLARAA